MARVARAIAPFVLSLLVAACSSDKKDNTVEREDYLDRTVQGIVKDGLSKNPSAGFQRARNKVDRSLDQEIKKHVGRLDFSSTSGKELVQDEDMAKARSLTADALGAKLDDKKVADRDSAAATVQTMLDELSSRYDGASSCSDLEDKKLVDCIVTVLIAEVRRCEKDQEPDAVWEEKGDEPGEAGAIDLEPADAGGSDAGRDAGARADAGATRSPLWGCDTRDISGATEMKTAVTTDQTWRGLIRVTGSVRVMGARLTIEPGTVILMESAASLDVGYGGAAGSLYAEGTEDEPIRFCGRNANPGYWNAIFLEPTVSRDSVLRHVLISDGGSSGASLVLSGAAIVDDVQVRNAGNDGVSAADFAPGSQNLTVEGSGKAAAVLSARAAVANFPLGGMFTGNSDNSVHINFLNFDQNVTLHNLGVPYVADQNMRLIGGTLTVDAGVEIKFKTGNWFDVAYGNVAATVLVNGTAAAPVTFSGVSTQPNGWAGVYIGTATNPNSTLSYLRIRNAGGASTPKALYVDAAITIDHVTVEQSAVGAQVGVAGFGSASKNLTVTGLTNAAERPLTLAPDAWGTVPPGSSFVGNATSQISVRGGNFTKVATVAKFDVPYFIEAGIRTQANSQLTLAPGTEFIMAGDVWLEIGYGNVSGARISAEGTADSPITFRGFDAVAGSWQGLSIGSNVSTSSALRYVDIAHAGGDASYPASIWLEAAIAIENCRIHDSLGYGISKRTANTTDYASMNTFTNVAMGAVTSR